MSKHTMAKPGRKKACNLCLSAETIEMLEQIKTALRRPSKSNVAEVLIYDKAKQLKLLAA